MANGEVQVIVFNGHTTNGTTTTTIQTSVDSDMQEVILQEFLEFLNASGFDVKSLVWETSDGIVFRTWPI